MRMKFQRKYIQNNSQTLIQQFGIKNFPFRFKQCKFFLLILSILLILMCSVSETAAYLLTNSHDTMNQFYYANITCEINENFDGNTKSNVSIKNTGNTSAYIRCTVVATWEDQAGSVLGQRPVLNSDYIMILKLDNGWTKGNDGYYYWSLPVNPNESTGVLITSLSANKVNTPPGYGLNVKILADAVQSIPSEAVIAAWNVDVNGDQVSKA